MKATLETIKAIGIEYDQLATTIHGGDTLVVICEIDDEDFGGYTIEWHAKNGRLVGVPARLPDGVLRALDAYDLLHADWKPEDVSE